MTSSPVTIQNLPPVVKVALSSPTPDTDATVTATAAPSDPDGDPVTLTYVWSIDGTTVKTTAAATSTTDSLDLSLPGNGNYGDGLAVSVTPSDGAVNGAATETANVTKPSTGTILEYRVAGAALPSGLATDRTGTSGSRLSKTATSADSLRPDRCRSSRY